MIVDPVAVLGASTRRRAVDVRDERTVDILAKRDERRHRIYNGYGQKAVSLVSAAPPWTTEDFERVSQRITSRDVGLPQLWRSLQPTSPEP